MSEVEPGGAATGGQTLIVSSRAAGMRLDRFLAGPLGSRARAQSVIDSGHVRIDGQARPKRHLMAEGEVVVVHTPPPAPGPGDGEQQARFATVYEDLDLIVVDKPAGVVVHPARGHRTGTLVQALGGRVAGGEDPGRAGIVHRLDRDTSGLLVVARNERVHRTLKEALARRELHREYVALVEGIPEARSGTIEAPIGRHRRDRKLMSIDSEHPRDARTHFEIEEVLPHETLLRVVLDTGRTHQIRVHLAAIGHPLCGDIQYGGAAHHGLGRQFLHARRLSFTHPVSGELMELTSSLPADLEAALLRAREGETAEPGRGGSAGGSGCGAPSKPAAFPSLQDGSKLRS